MNKNQKIYRQCHHKCEDCGFTEDLLVHHIDQDRSNNEFSNFKVLCTSCHAIVHKRITNITKMKPYYETSPNQLTFEFI
jgi:5-methylcytosine-specific restriction endonuclease McrA